jgi:hypothetical protein
MRHTSNVAHTRKGHRRLKRVQWCDADNGRSCSPVCDPNPCALMPRRADAALVPEAAGRVRARLRRVQQPVGGHHGGSARFWLGHCTCASRQQQHLCCRLRRRRSCCGHSWPVPAAAVAAAATSARATPARAHSLPPSLPLLLMPRPAPMRCCRAIVRHQMGRLFKVDSQPDVALVTVFFGVNDAVMPGER